MNRLKFLLLHRYWHRTGGMMGFAVLLGLTGGVAAAIFKWTLLFVQGWVLTRLAGFPDPGTDHHWIPRYLFFLVPTAGGLLSGIIVYRFAPEAAGAGTDALIDAYHNKNGHVPLRVAIVKFFASIVTLGSGGSAGQEGPMAQIGGGLGSFVGRFFRLPDKQRRLLLLTGTSAGLGAIFHAPLGASLTAAEIVYKEDFESQGILPFIVASVVAFATFTLLTHQHSTYLHFPMFPFTNPLELFAYALVGLACVPFSWAFVRFYRKTRDLFARLRIPNFLKPALGGLLVGLLAYVCPQAAGTNWGYLGEAVTGKFPWLLLLSIAAAKILATSFTIGSGGSGGVFGPSLFIGGMVGGAVGFGIHDLEPTWASNPGAFVLVGMGAFFAGAAKAPLAGLIMVCEITGNYGLLPPLLIATTLHLALSRKWSLYDSQRQNKFSSPVHQHALRVDVLKHVPLADLLPSVREAQTLAVDWKLAAVYEKIQSLDHDVFPVVREDGSLAGLLTASALHLGTVEYHAQDTLLVQDVMDKSFSLDPVMDLHEALAVFLESGATELPILGAHSKVVGTLRLHDIMARYDLLTRPDEHHSDVG